MAQLDDLKVAIAAYLGKVPTDFIIGGSDLLLLAINNAKKWAQAQRDFDACRVQAKVTVSLSSGALLSGLTLLDGTTSITVKLIEAAYLSWNDQVLKPINFIDRKTQSSELRQRLRGWPFRQTLDSPPIDYSNSLGVEDTPNLFQQGTRIYLWPQSNSAFGSSTSIVATFDVVQWLPDYTSTSAVTIASAGTAGYNAVYTAYGSINGQTLYINAANSKVLFWLSGVWYLVPITALSTSVVPTLGYSFAVAQVIEAPFLSPDGTYAVLSGSTTGAPTAVSATTNIGTDWFLVNGFEFLMWKAIVDGNYLWQKFAQFQEGFLAAPKDLMQSAWANLQALDGELIGQNTTAFTLD